MTNLRVFDFRQWWKMNHYDQDQMELMGHIMFVPVQGYTHLFAANVSEDDEIMLKLLGIPRDPTILTDGQIPTQQTSKMLHKSGERFLIVEISHATLPKEQ